MIVPPLWLDGLTTVLIASLKWLVEVGELELDGLLPPHAASASASAATAPTPAGPRYLRRFICLLPPVGVLSVTERRCPVQRASAATGVESVAEPVAEEVEGHHGYEDRQPGDDHVHRVDRVEPLAHRGREHLPPARGWRDQADAQVVERGLEQDIRRDQQRGVDQDRADQVRQQLAEQDVGPARAEAAGGVDELALAQRQRLAPDDPAHVRPGEEPDDEDQQYHPQAVPGQPEARAWHHADQ